MPGRCRCRPVEQSKGEANGYHRGLHSIDPLHVRAVQNVLVPLAGLQDGSPYDDGESDKQNRFGDRVFNTFRPSIEDRPATVVNKIGATTGSGAINGRCDIFAASAHRPEQVERRGNNQRPFRWVIREMPGHTVSLLAGIDG
jgi:hypothetical protein